MNNKEIGAHIKQLGENWKREQPGRTLAKLCDEMGIQRAQWYQMIAGDSVGHKSIKRAAEFFGVSEISILSLGKSDNLSEEQLQRVINITRGIGALEKTLPSPLTPEMREAFLGLLLQDPKVITEADASERLESLGLAGNR